MRFDLHIASDIGSFAIFDPTAVEEVISAGRDNAEALDEAAEEGRLIVCYDVRPRHKHDLSVVLRIGIDESEDSVLDEHLLKRCHQVLNNARLSIPGGWIYGVGGEYLEVSDDWEGTPANYRPRRHALLSEGREVPRGEYRVRGFRIEWDELEREGYIERRLGPDAVRTGKWMDRMIRGGCLSLSLAVMVTPLMLVTAFVANWGIKWLLAIASVGLLMLMGGLFGVYRSASARYQRASLLRYEAESEFPHGLILLERIEPDSSLPDEFTAGKMAWSFG